LVEGNIVVVGGWGTVGKPKVCPSPVWTGRHFPAH